MSVRRSRTCSSDISAENLRDGVIDGDVVSASALNQSGVTVVSIALVHLGTLIPMETCPNRGI